MTPLQAAVDRLLRLRVEVTATCWLWRGSQSLKGRGRTSIFNKPRVAHRVFYEHYKGEIPEGYFVVATCENRLCVNPGHLKAVERRDVILRGGTLAAINAAKTHCIRDHALTGANLYVNPKGNRECRACRKVATEASRRRKHIG